MAFIFTLLPVSSIDILVVSVSFKPQVNSEESNEATAVFIFMNVAHIML